MSRIKKQRAAIGAAIAKHSYKLKECSLCGETDSWEVFNGGTSLQLLCMYPNWESV